MKNWMIGIRGAVLMVILWVIGWGLGFGGIMELIDSDGKVQDVWLTVLAVPGFIGGVIFAALLLTADRGTSFDRIPLFHFALWGAVTGIVLGLLTIPAEVGDASPGALGMTGLATILGLIAGLGSGIFCRLASRWFTRPIPS